MTKSIFSGWTTIGGMSYLKLIKIHIMVPIMFDLIQLQALNINLQRYRTYRCTDKFIGTNCALHINAWNKGPTFRQIEFDQIIANQTILYTGTKQILKFHTQKRTTSKWHCCYTVVMFWDQNDLSLKTFLKKLSFPQQWITILAKHLRFYHVQWWTHIQMYPLNLLQ